MNRNILRLLPLLLLMGLALASASSCGHGSKEQQDTTAWDYKAPPAMPINRAITGDSMGLIDDAEIHRLPTYIEQRPLKEIFNDSNALQLVAAEQNGFKPVTCLREIQGGVAGPGAEVQDAPAGGDQGQERTVLRRHIDALRAGDEGFRVHAVPVQCIVLQHVLFTASLVFLRSVFTEHAYRYTVRIRS